MSDTTGGGEEGGVADAGQDEGADNESPHLAPSLPGHSDSEVGETSKEGAPPSAKRTKVSADDQDHERVKETDRMGEETQESMVQIRFKKIILGKEVINSGLVDAKLCGLLHLQRYGAATMWGRGRFGCSVCRML